MKSDFREVREELRQRILQGVWAPGDLVPNEVDLAAEFGCARATVNRAMRELAEAGLIERKRKAGTRVRLSPRRAARFDIPIVREEIEARGAAYRYALISRDEIAPPDWLAARMALAPGDLVLHLTCLHHADGQPYQHEERWISLAALPQARDGDFTTTGPNEWLVREVPFSDAEISFSAIAADDQLARRMGCTAGDALFLVERATWWEGRAITFVRLAHQRGHRMTTRY